MIGETVPENPERPLSASEYIDRIVGGADYASAVHSMILFLAGKATDTGLLDNGQRAKMMADVPYDFTKAISGNKDPWLPPWLKESIDRAYDGIAGSRPNQELESERAYSSIAVLASGASGDDMSRMISRALSELEAKGSTAKYLDILVPSPVVKGSESIELPHPDPEDYGSRYDYEVLEEYILEARRKEHRDESGPYTAREAAILAVLNHYGEGANPDFETRESYDAGGDVTIDTILDPIEHGDSQVIPRIIESEAYDYRTTFLAWAEHIHWFREGPVAAVTLEQDAISLDAVARNETLGSSFSMPVLGMSAERLPVRDKLLSLIASATPLRDLYEKVSTESSSPSRDDIDADAGRYTT